MRRKSVRSRNRVRVSYTKKNACLPVLKVFRIFLRLKKALKPLKIGHFLKIDEKTFNTGKYLLLYKEKLKNIKELIDHLPVLKVFIERS